MYLNELTRNWRSLLAAAFGMAAGHTINNYLNNLFIPHLMKEFAWDSSSIALIGLPVILSIVAQPIAGRMTDLYGVRRVALVGVIGSPLVYLAFSRMQGSFAAYFALNVVQILLIAATTGPVVYSRIVAQNYRLALGTALAIISCTPSLVGFGAVPFLSDYIEANGWRAGYVALATGVALLGGIALLMMPPTKRRDVGDQAGRTPAVIDYRGLFLSTPFLIVIAGMFLCNLSVVMQTSQLKVIMLGIGVASAGASLLVSLYPAGVFLGRLLCGLALDKLPTHLVAAVALGMPGVGLGILAMGSPNETLLGAAVLLLGLSLGADGDIAAYLARKYFRLETYSTVLGFIVGAIAFSGSIGSVLLSLFLRFDDDFTPFLLFSAGAAFTGSALFLLLRGVQPAQAPMREVPAE